MIIMKTLATLKSGETARIVDIQSSTKGFTRRLCALGIRPDVNIQVIRNYKFFPLQIRVGMTELMMRKQHAQEIMVE